MSKNENPRTISLSLELCSSTNMHKTQYQLLALGVPDEEDEGCSSVHVYMCEIVCLPGLPVVPGLGSKNTIGQQLRPVALVGVNKRDRGSTSTKEGQRGTIRGGRALRGLRLCGDRMEGTKTNG